MNYYARRIARSGLTFGLVLTITFALIRLMPGGPVDYMRAQLRQQYPNAPQEKIDNLVRVYVGVKPDEPIWIQYLNYMSDVLRGDLGVSTFYNEPVAQIYAEAIPWTLFVLGTALILSFLISVALGAFLAYVEGTKTDVVLSSLSVTMNSIPYYVAAIVLIAVFVTMLGWFPAGNRMSLNVEPGFNVPFILDILYHAALPIMSVVLTGFGARALGMRGNSIRVLGEDYIRVARLRALPRNRIAMRYVARNAILPIYTGFIIQIGFVLGGSVILEQIFQYPGVGYYFCTAISSRDYPLMMGGFLVITVAVVIAVFVADMTYGKLDPRASSGGDNREAY